jgi:hypothetical protein
MKQNCRSGTGSLRWLATSAIIAGALFAAAPASASMANAPRASGAAIQQGVGEGGLVEQVRYRRHHRHYRRWSPARVCHYEWRRRWTHGHSRSYRVRVCRFG